jgi:predicted phosphoribosyltransferase
VPCASASAAREFERTADRFLSLVVDPGFMAVGQYYADFSPVADDEVIKMLTGTGGPVGSEPGASTGPIPAARRSA